MNFFEKLKETLASVLPIMILVLILGFTITPLDSDVILRFVIGGFLVVVGLSVFLLGVDIGILPMGERSGAALTSKRNLWLLLGVSFFIGLIVTLAEPDVQVLANQVRGIDPAVNKNILVVMIALGVGLFVSLGILRTVLSIPLKYFFTVSYILVFVLAFASPESFQGVSFDAGGATTGPMTVPFIMALGVGVAAVRAKSSSDRKSTQEDSISSDESFGLTGIASVGPVLAVIIYGILNSRNSGVSQAIIVQSVESASGMSLFFQEFPSVVKEVLVALAPLAGMAFIFQLMFLKLPPMQVVRMIRGFVFSFLGLVMFLLGAQCGFMPAGRQLGEVLGAAAQINSLWFVLLVVIGLVFGAIVVCAEPAVWVLTDQVESITGGTIKRKVMLVALSAGVAVSVGISMLRVFYGFSLWYVLVPGYMAALGLSYFCPKLFTGIAFDSGGVASGPMTSTFILSFALGASSASGGNPATDAFGIIAFVAMTPLIAIQLLGIIFRLKMKIEKNKRNFQQ